MNYHVGERVRITSEWTEQALYQIDADHEMDEYLGQEMTIRSVEGGWYRMTEDSRPDFAGWYWSEDMIEGLAPDEREMNPLADSAMDEMM